MIKRTLTALILLPGMAHAVICKSVDAEGVVAYTDVPAFECQDPVRLPGGVGAKPGATDNEAAFEGYTSIQVVKPEADGVVRSKEGRVPLAIALEPALQEGHRIGVYVDGALVPGSFAGLAIDLTGIDPGTHSVRVAVFDGLGRRLNDSAVVQFTLDETGLTEGSPPPIPLPEADRASVAPDKS